MAGDEKSGVVNGHGQTFAVSNLYIAGGSSLPTQGSANPALTIMAIAARLADHLISATPEKTSA
jgi:choline dehydrogenase-like flavoprotein